MTTPKSVLGVSGVCRVGLGYPTQFQSSVFVGFRRVCWLCWFLRRVRACVTLFSPKAMVVNFSYARTEKPNKPNTLNSKFVRVLILKGFICVGFVLGSGFSVLGSVFRGKGR